jgi:3-oxoacyl-[acyl-carrier protein] reductase
MHLLITGGASGLGLAITKALANNFPDADIYFTFNSSAENANMLEAGSSRLHGIQCDFSKQNDIEQLCRLIENSEIDVLVNNAFSKFDKQYFHKTEQSVYTESFNLDVVSTLAITKSFIAKARSRKSGKIITILTAALLGPPAIGWSVYLANKAYLLAMHKSWAVENKAFNITSNCISPDFMVTPFHDQTDERVIQNLIAAHPLKKLLTVEEVAQTVLFLCNAPAQLNGQNIVLNAAMNV